MPNVELIDWGELVIGVMIAALLVVGVLAVFNGDAKTSPIARLKKSLGLAPVPSALLVIFGLFWIFLFLMLFGSLILAIFRAVGLMLEQKADTTIRAEVILITGLTATLGAVVALPFTLIRQKLTRDQNVHGGDVLFNEKTTEAQRDLYAQRQVTKPVTASGGEHKHQDFWEDDIVRRNAAIDQLERLVEERPQTAVGVGRMLSVYVKELSKVYPPVEPPSVATPIELQNWARSLRVQRSDMEKAVQTLGRLGRWAPHEREDLSIDLQGCNLQAMQLANLNFNDANFSACQMQGASLYETKFQRAKLYFAEMQGTQLVSVDFQAANLGTARLGGASLADVQLQLAQLDTTQLNEIQAFQLQMQGALICGPNSFEMVNLSDCSFRGAALRNVDFSTVIMTQTQVESVFGDETVTLPPNVDPPEWFSKGYENWDAFDAAWVAWQKKMGFDPDDPETWEQAERRWVLAD